MSNYAHIDLPLVPYTPLPSFTINFSRKTGDQVRKMFIKYLLTMNSTNDWLSTVRPSDIYSLAIPLNSFIHNATVNSRVVSQNKSPNDEVMNQPLYRIQNRWYAWELTKTYYCLEYWLESVCSQMNSFCVWLFLRRKNHQEFTITNTLIVWWQIRGDRRIYVVIFGFWDVLGIVTILSLVVDMFSVVG